MRAILACAVALACFAVPASFALGPDSIYEVFGTPRFDISNLEYNHNSIVSLDPDALKPYNLHRYIIDGQVTVLEGAFNLQGMRDIWLSSHESSTGVYEAANLDVATGALDAHTKYDATGDGIVVAVVDTGTDFSNPDMINAVARDADNRPIMLDPDGQGIVLTNNTFTAFVDRNGAIRNAADHTVFVDHTGVYLGIARGGEGTEVSVYNSLYPVLGNAPVLTGMMYYDYQDRPRCNRLHTLKERRIPSGRGSPGHCGAAAGRTHTGYRPARAWRI